MPSEQGDVLLTGATGFLGMELLTRYLERTDRTVLALVRARDAEQSRARIRAVLELLFGSPHVHPGRVLPIAGDIERDGLGLARADRELVTSRAAEIVHCAATVSFTTGLEDSRRINVQGTRELLGLAAEGADRGVLRRFAHVSTAYVAGTHGGPFGEDDLEMGQDFRNPYERSKFEAERLVRSRAAELPSVVILRPSIIVGESTTGWTPAFNVLYVPLRAFANGKLRVLPAAPKAPVDVVPADFVADSILELTGDADEGLKTYHLVAGDRATTVERLLELSTGYLGRPRPRIVSPRLYRAAFPALMACSGGQRRAALKRTAPFLPYYTMRVRYRRDRAAKRLGPAGLRPPPLDAYYERLLDYAAQAEWGKRPLAHPRAAVAAAAGDLPPLSAARRDTTATPLPG